MRFGNAHVYNIFVDDTLSAPFEGTQTAVNSTINAAVLVENSDFLEVQTPLMFSGGGRITQRGSQWTFNGALTPFNPAQLNPVDPNALVWNPPASFTWTDLTTLPYPYTLSPLDFVRNNPNQIGTITPADDTDRALLRGYLPLTSLLATETPTPPSITTQPASQTVQVGSDVTFSVVASGTAPLSYQWKKDGADIPGATSAALTLTNVQLSEAGGYGVEVSNNVGVATSDPATLTVTVAPVFFLRERFADGDRTTQNLPDSAAWFTSSGSNNLTATVGQATQIVSSSCTLLTYFTNASATPASVGVNQTLTLDFTVQFTGFDTAAAAGANTFVVGLLRSVANPDATSGTGFTPTGSPNTNARVSGDFGSNNPASNVFNNYGGYAAMTYTGSVFTTPIRLYARTGVSASLLNSTSPFTQFTGAAPTPSTEAMVANTDYRGTLTLQNTGSGVSVSYTLRNATTGSVVMTYSAVQAAASFTQFDTVAFYLSKASGSANYNFIIEAVDVSLSGDSPGDPPVITTQPVSQTVSAGANVTFTVGADGAAPLSYQWLKNGAAMAGATAASLTLTNVQAADAGAYRAVVSNAAGSATSATAVLSVETGPVAPSITSQPASQIVVVGGQAGFTVIATGTAPLSYQWRKNGSPIAGATAATLNLANVQQSDSGDYSVTVSNSVGTATSGAATLTVSDTLPTALYDLAGFARAATGGGLTPESDPNYRKVFTADDLVAALGNRNTKVIEIMNDLDLGFNEVPATTGAGALRSASAPLLHPALLTTGVSLIDIQDKNGLTIFSANGATIRHATFNVKRANNVIIRNLKFDELWEWDESSKGKYDKQGWDFITVDMTSDNIWIDHCTFTKAYDGVIDIKGGTRNVTISWCSFLGDDGGPGSFVRRQIEALDQNRPAYPMYDFLRSNGFSVEDIIAISRSQKKGSLVGANELDPANANHQVTLHHNYYLNMQDRLPRLRAGNAHAYDIYVNNAEAFAAKGMRDATVAAMTPSNAAKLNGSNATYSFDVVLNGAISTEGGAVLLEKSQLIGVVFPLRNNQKDASLTQYTGKILALDTLYQLGGLVFRGDSNTPDSPLAPVPAPELAFSWNGFATLPYVYTTHDPTQLPLLLTGAEGAGAGRLIWAKENWLKTSY
jgi:pectate lyase